VLIRNAVASIALAAIAALGGVAPARGVTFYYDAYGGFISGTDSPAGSGTFANDPDTASGGTFDVGANADPRMPSNQFVDVTWGTALGAQGPYDGKSGFALSKVDDGVVTVNGPLVEFGKLTHFNRPIALVSDLDFVQLEWNLQLFATAGDAAANTNPVKTVTLRYTLYNWETPNDPTANPAYQVSYDKGATWTTVGPGVCPGSTPAGTLIVGHLGKIYESAFTDQAGYPPWNGECSDAHIYESSSANVDTFSHGGREYRVRLVGFYGPFGDLTNTFWACENNQCFGTVKFQIVEVAAPIPVDSRLALALTALLLAGLGSLALRRASGRRS
jgi:hypothetical protein